MPALAVAASLLAGGCLVPEAPEYGPPGKTTPIIDMQQVVPSPYQILVLYPAETVQFTIPVRSEDAGDSLALFLWVDYRNNNPEAGQFLGSWESPASPEPRNISITWDYDPRVTRGCHQLTMFVTHRENYDLSGRGRDPNDIASVSWWTNVDPAQPNVLVDCPTVSVPPVTEP